MLQKLTRLREGAQKKTVKSLQQIIVFDNAFEKLLDVIAEEGHSDGNIVVEDCLVLASNLLVDNASNQTYFKETRYA